MESDSKPSSPEAPTRRSPLLDYYSSSAGNSIRRFFSSREKVTEQIKTMLWVIPITLVIWVYAEREQVVVPVAPNVSAVPITLRIADNLTFEPLGVGDTGPMVSLQLTGPQQALERVRELLTTRIPHGLTIDMGTLPVSNSEPVNLLDHIANQEVFKSNCVSVMKVTPENIYVRVERKIKKDLPVLIPPEIDTLTSDTHFTPPVVTVSGPESLLGADCKVYANLTPSQVPKKPGSYALPAISLKLPNSKLQTDPPQVSGNLVVRDADVTFDIPRMYIYTKSPATMKNYVVLSNDGTIDDTHVTGPADKIKLLQDGTFTPEADLVVLPSDPAGSKPLIYVLPEGVTVVADDLRRQVDFTLAAKQ
jgi:hypothetical protein